LNRALNLIGAGIEQAPFFVLDIFETCLCPYESLAVATVQRELANGISLKERGEMLNSPFRLYVRLLEAFLLDNEANLPRTRHLVCLRGWCVAGPSPSTAASDTGNGRASHQNQPQASSRPDAPPHQFPPHPHHPRWSRKHFEQTDRCYLFKEYTEPFE